MHKRNSARRSNWDKNVFFVPSRLVDDGGVWRRTNPGQMEGIVDAVVGSLFSAARIFGPEPNAGGDAHHQDENHLRLCRNSFGFIPII